VMTFDEATFEAKQACDFSLNSTA